MERLTRSKMTLVVRENRTSQRAKTREKSQRVTLERDRVSIGTLSWHTEVMSSETGSTEARAQKIAKELATLRQRGLSAVEIENVKQKAIDTTELMVQAKQHSGRLGRVWDPRGGIKRFLMDSLAAFGAEPEYADDAQLVTSLFFDPKGKNIRAGTLLKEARNGLEVEASAFRTVYQAPTFLSFARYIVAWDGSAPPSQTVASTVLIPLSHSELENTVLSVGSGTTLQTTPVFVSVAGKKLLVAVKIVVLSLLVAMLGSAAWLSRFLWGVNSDWHYEGHEPAESEREPHDELYSVKKNQVFTDQMASEYEHALLVAALPLRYQAATPVETTEDTDSLEARAKLANLLSALDQLQSLKTKRQEELRLAQSILGAHENRRAVWEDDPFYSPCSVSDR